MKQDWSISVVVPVYNEAVLLKKSIFAINSFLTANFAKYEIIIVESASSDGSDKLSDRLAAANSHMRVIHEEARNGYGSAVRLGMGAAKGDLIWPVPADLPFKLSTIRRALPLLSVYDCVFSFRTVDQRSLTRRTAAYFYNFLVKLLLGLPVRHVNSAFKVFKRNILKQLKVDANGWFFDAEFVYKLARNKIPYVEIGVALLERKSGKSTVGSRAIMQTLLELFEFFGRRYG